MNDEGGENLWKGDGSRSQTESVKEVAQSPEADMPKPKSAKSSNGIHWTASDSIEHHRGQGWYFGLIGIVVAISALLVVLYLFDIFSLTTSVTTEILVLVMLAALLVVTRQPPREVQYTLTDEGLAIDNQLHPFSEFRAFGVRKVGAMWQLVLIPVKRFGFSVTMFINEDQGEKIVDEFGARLPMEDIKPDFIDNLIRRLKI